MRPTIKNKLVGGFSAVLALMGVVAAIGVYSVLSLRTSALETARVGDRLNSISLEIQVHNLEAQRKSRIIWPNLSGWARIRRAKPIWMRPNSKSTKLCRWPREGYALPLPMRSGRNFN